jgi:hypothetical protein
MAIKMMILQVEFSRSVKEEYASEDFIFPVWIFKTISRQIECFPDGD